MTREPFAGGRAFLTLESFSIMGTQVGFSMIPLIAVYALGATSIQLGVLSAVDFVPVVFFGIFFGVMIDVGNPRRIAILASGVRVTSLAVLVLLFALGAGSICLLIAMGFTVALGSAAHDTSVQSLVPLTFRKSFITFANSRFELGRSIGATIGPAAAGMLISLGGAAAGLAILCATYLSGLLGVAIVRPSGMDLNLQKFSASFNSVIRGIPYGFIYLKGRSDIVTAIVLAAISNLASASVSTLAFLHLKNKYGLTSELSGVTASIGGACAVLVALFAGRIARIGPARLTLSIALACSSLSALAFSLIPASSWFGIIASGVVLGLNYSSNLVFNVRMVSFRQATVPQEYLARVNSVVRSLIMVSLPLGSLLAGFLSSAYTPTIAIGSVAIGSLICFTAALIMSRNSIWSEDRSPLHNS